MNNIKRKSIVICFAIIIINIMSCEVDRLPETQISDGSFWQSESDLKAATNYLYTFLPGLPVTTDIWSDDAYAKSSNSISDGSRLTPASDGFYNTQYHLIIAANNIIEKSALVLEAGVDPENVSRYRGEAYFYRAWAYFDLLKRYGGVPLITQTLTETAPELGIPKASREDVLTLIYSDLDNAIEVLRVPSQMESSNFGRISKTTALAFKSSVGLFEGTRCKFHNYGDATKHLTLAKQAAKIVIESGEHDIFPDYFNLYQYEGEGSENKENILVRKYGKSPEESISYHNAQRNLEVGDANPTKSLADSYLMMDGLPIDKSPMYNEPRSTVEVFVNRDPRMGATFFKTGDSYIGTQPEFTIPFLSFNKTGFANRRYANINDWQISRSYIDRAIIRYAEVLLNYAEATYELDDKISDQDLNKSINKLRNRPSVNMPSLTNSFVASNNLNMQEEIRRERRVELALDGFRYWDLIRWKTAEIELPKTVLGNYLFEEFGVDREGVSVDENNFIILQSTENRSFNPEKDYLWPFPTDQIALNPNLKQNPNW